MSTINYFEDLDENELSETLVAKGKRASSFRYSGTAQKITAQVRQFIRTQDDSKGNFKFTYKAARFEEGWLLGSLGDFYERAWISDVIKRVKGGKEASIYLCSAGTEVKTDLLAAKVYRPRSLRNLKNDHTYREGRSDLDDEGKIILNDGMQHAMAKRTDYGKNLLHQSWIAYEFTTLQKLFSAGADVPEPFEMANNAILMGYIGDINSCAPTLSEISLRKSEAIELFDRILYNIDLLLSLNCIHGDLSAYNILYWDNRLTLIDFPQTISPTTNRNSLSIFKRDVTRVCEYFSKQGIKVNPQAIANDLWKKNNLKLNPDVDIRLLDADDPQDRAFWRKQKGQG
jgi:RIO kinase 1